MCNDCEKWRGIALADEPERTQPAVQTDLFPPQIQKTVQRSLCSLYLPSQETISLSSPSSRKRSSGSLRAASTIFSATYSADTTTIPVLVSASAIPGRPEYALRHW